MIIATICCQGTSHLFFLLRFCERLEHSTQHLICISYNLGYMLIIQLFSLQGITHLCQLFLFRSMNSSNYTSSLSSYYPKQSKSEEKKKKSSLRTATVCYPGEGNGNPLQHLGLGSPTDRGAWQGIVRGVAKSRTRLSDFTVMGLCSAGPH